MPAAPSRPAPDPVESRLAGLSCTACGQDAPPDAWGPCAGCAAPLACRYELAGFEPPAPGRDVFRWAGLLPVRDPARRLSLGEGGTPVLTLPTLARELGLDSLWLKDEGQAPQGSFKARSMAVAMAAHAERGATSVTIPSAGNAGTAGASFARRHGLGCRVILPSAATPAYRIVARLAGARVIAVTGDLAAAGAWALEHPGPPGDHLLAGFREPFRLEGNKTMGFEIWERFGDALPDAIVLPTGGGAGLVALHRAFAQLRGAGLLAAPTPRLVAAQIESCAPLVRAFAEGADDVMPWETTRRTLAEGLRVPRLGGGRLALAALRESAGMARAVAEPRLVEAIRRCALAEGFLPGAEGGVALAAIEDLLAAGELKGARVLVVNTSSIFTSPETLQAAGAG